MNYNEESKLRNDGEIVSYIIGEFNNSVFIDIEERISTYIEYNIDVSAALFDYFCMKTDCKRLEKPLPYDRHFLILRDYETIYDSIDYEKKQEVGDFLILTLLQPFDGIYVSDKEYINSSQVSHLDQNDWDYFQDFPLYLEPSKAEGGNYFLSSSFFSDKETVDLVFDIESLTIDEVFLNDMLVYDQKDITGNVIYESKDPVVLKVKMIIRANTIKGENTLKVKLSPSNEDISLHRMSIRHLLVL